MNKKILTISVAILALIIAGGIYLLLSDDAKQAKDQMVNKNATSQQSNIIPAEDSTGMQGSYIDYSDNAIANTGGTKLIFFHAPWCPQCRALEADINSKGVPDGVTIIKVDYDTSHELRQKYGVTLQTTLVRVDDEGRLIKKFVAYDDPSLESVKNNLL